MSDAAKTAWGETLVEWLSSAERTTASVQDPSDHDQTSSSPYDTQKQAGLDGDTLHQKPLCHNDSLESSQVAKTAVSRS
jgi:hypothetical protein